MRLAQALLGLATLIHVISYVVAAPEHVVDTSWPLHARFHVLQALQWAVGFDLVVAWLIVRLARERWVLGPLAIAFVLLHGAYFVSFAVRGGEPSNVSAHIALGTAMALYAAGLAVAWRIRS
jgi:hypothetical protein